MAYQHPRLIERLEERLGMTNAEAREKFADLKRFLYLCAVSAESLAPTEQIDEVWHNFMLYSEDYARFCDTLCGGMIHHRPWNKAEVAASDWSIVQRTRQLAEATYGAELSANWDYAEHPGSCDHGS
jgi:hypothetical protein